MGYLHPFVIYAITGVGLGTLAVWLVTRLGPSLSPSRTVGLWLGPLWAPGLLYGLGLAKRPWLGCVAAPGLAAATWPLSTLGDWICRAGSGLGRVLAPFFVLALIAGIVKAAAGLWLAGRLGSRSGDAQGTREKVDRALSSLRAASLVGERAGTGDRRMRSAVAGARVVVTRRVHGLAFTVGLRHPVIVLSRSLLDQLDDDELEAVLAHELAHVAAGDHWRKWLATLCRDVLAFTGVSLAVFRRLRSSMEAAADESAVRLTERPLALASSLIKSWRLGQSRRLDARGRSEAWALDGFASGLIQGEVTSRVERLILMTGSAAAKAGDSGQTVRRERLVHWSVAVMWALIGVVSLALC